jgi:hypothetical protein
MPTPWPRCQNSWRHSVSEPWRILSSGPQSWRSVFALRSSLGVPRYRAGAPPWPRRQPARTVVSSRHWLKALSDKKAIMAVCRCQARRPSRVACNISARRHCRFGVRAGSSSISTNRKSGGRPALPDGMQRAIDVVQQGKPFALAMCHRIVALRQHPLDHEPPPAQVFAS